MKQRRLSFHGRAQELCQTVFTFHTAVGLYCTSVQKSVYLERAILCTLVLLQHTWKEKLSSGHSFQDSSPIPYQVDSEHVIKSSILSSPKELIPPASSTKVPALADTRATCRRLFTHSFLVPLESHHRCLSLCVGDMRTEMKMTLHRVLRAWPGGSLTEQQPEPCSRGMITLPISLGKIIPCFGSPPSLPYKSRHSVWFQWKQL